MKIREHFLLGSQEATISATAKVDCDRKFLFHHAVTVILTRYQEEFGEAALKEFIEQIATGKFEGLEWRFDPNNSCWSNADKIL